jgi:two-component system NtrC family sensor kinase
MNPRILVIDDNPAIHDDFRKVLAGAGRSGFAEAEAAFFGEPLPVASQPEFKVDYALQGLDAIELFRQAHERGAPPAVAFVDVRMPPGIDGVETVARLWEIDPELQIVICSAYTDYSWQEMVAKLAHRDRLLVLKKPFDGIEVLQLACALTEKWELTRQAAHSIDRVEREVTARTSALVEANARLEREIEQRKSAEEQLLRSQRLESIGTLASGIAHDLNNLLSPVMMGTQLLQDGTLRPDQEELLEMIQTATRRGSRIVAQMLTFARGSTDDHTVQHAGLLLLEIAKIVSETFPQNIQVKCQTASDLRLMSGNATQIHQVLMNLCVNARDAMPTGGIIRLEVENFTVDASYASGRPDMPPGEYVLLRVSDTGIGIPEEIRDKIFEPFFSTKAPGKGTGLGLSTTAGIVRNHGGFLEVKSAPGEGTTFYVYLPADLENEMIPDRPEMMQSLRGHGELILVVDDESALRDITSETLIRHGYRTITASDGAEAITAYAQAIGEIDAVLTDVHMPIVDGPAFARALKTITPDLRILLMSGAANDARLKEFDMLGISGFLPKPYSSEQLLRAMHQTLLPL